MKGRLQYSSSLGTACWCFFLLTYHIISIQRIPITQLPPNDIPHPPKALKGVIPILRQIPINRYARAVIRSCVTDIKFSSLSRNTHIALARMTAPLAAKCGPQISSRSYKFTIINN